MQQNVRKRLKCKSPNKIVFKLMRIYSSPILPWDRIRWLLYFAFFVRVRTGFFKIHPSNGWFFGMDILYVFIWNRTKICQFILNPFEIIRKKIESHVAVAAAAATATISTCICFCFYLPSPFYAWINIRFCQSIYRNFQIIIVQLLSLPY